MTASPAHPSPVLGDCPVSTRDLRRTAARFIFTGNSALDPRALAAAQGELGRRMSQAISLGLTEREVVRALLHPLWAREGHCRCPSCRERCVTCR